MTKKKWQYRRAVTGRTRRLILLAAALAAGAAIIIGVAVYQRTRPYQPPPFEVNAIAGEPEPPEEAGYGIGGAPTADSFQVGLASNWIRREDGSLPVWFTNPKENSAYLLLQVKRASDGKLLYESGLLRPGEYVEALAPLRKLPDTPIEAKLTIYSLEPETYHSLGALNMGGTIQ